MRQEEEVEKEEAEEEEEEHGKEEEHITFAKYSDEHHSGTCSFPSAFQR